MAVDDVTLHKMAQRLRRDCLESTSAAGSGHPTSCMSAAELVSVLFFDEMRFDPRDPSGRDQDVFVLSKGHAAPVLWAVHNGSANHSPERSCGTNHECQTNFIDRQHV